MVLQLANGHFFEGQIKRVRNDKITLGDRHSEFTFALDDVTLAEPDSPALRTFSQLPEASLTLKNGQRIRGRLVMETPKHVVLAYPAGRLMVPRENVRQVSHSGRVHF
jgi:hypothetical protein